MFIMIKAISENLTKISQNLFICSLSTQKRLFEIWVTPYQQATTSDINMYFNILAFWLCHIGTMDNSLYIWCIQNADGYTVQGESVSVS